MELTKKDREILKKSLKYANEKEQKIIKKLLKKGLTR